MKAAFSSLGAGLHLFLNASRLHVGRTLIALEERYRPPRWQDDDENTLWLDLLLSFVTVKNLYLTDEFVPRIAPALQELVGGRTTEVLPTLENIFQPWGPMHEGVERFVAARICALVIL